MHNQPEDALNPPFSLLTVSSHPDRPDTLVGLSFHTGSSGEQGTSPWAICHSYEDQNQAPILTVSQDHSYVSVSPANPRQVSDADVRVAKELAMAALQYYEGMHRARRTQPPQRQP